MKSLIVLFPSFLIVLFPSFLIVFFPSFLIVLFPSFLIVLFPSFLIVLFPSFLIVLFPSFLIVLFVSFLIGPFVSTNKELKKRPVNDETKGLSSLTGLFFNSLFVFLSLIRINVNEGYELAVLRSVNWDKVDIEVKFYYKF